MIARMEGLKRKLESLRGEEVDLHRQARRRIEHLSTLHDISGLTDARYEEWARVRLNRLLVDYLLRQGYGDSATALARENKIEDLVDVDAFVQCHAVEASLKQGRMTECLAWCNDNKQALKKINVSVLGNDELRLLTAPTE